MINLDFGNTGVRVRAILEACLEGRGLGLADALLLDQTTGPELAALCATADALRREQVGDDVSYVVNRNINFTNVCVKTCKFCAFSRTHRSEEAYFLPTQEIVRRALEAREYGATEVCLQAGLAPGMDGRHYIELCRALKQAAPELHLHAFSPEEIKYGARLAKLSVRSYLEELREAGLGTLPGTSAEVLDDELRDRIAPDRITTAEWIDVVRTAHELGIRTTSTLMFGHVETSEQRLRHLDLLRSIQRETGGFTEFVPLSFVHEEAPMFRDQLLPELRSGPSVELVTRLYAIARLMLGKDFRNIQVSWVKVGFARAERLLACGANDLGGTLMNESISTAAGASHGQLATPATLRALIRRAGRIPVERDTLYRPRRRFSADGAGDPELGALDRVTDADATFGSYAALSQGSLHRFELRRKPRPDKVVP
jgi:7,8-didemethyl-8-hydroxy-5-deazariboflavin synthase CofH subunit